jgi:hypothetical protein
MEYDFFLIREGLDFNFKVSVFSVQVSGTTFPRLRMKLPKMAWFLDDLTGRNSEQIERRTSNAQHRTSNIDDATLYRFYIKRTQEIRGADSLPALVATSVEKAYFVLFLNRQNTLFDVGRSMFDVGRLFFC